MVHNIISLVVFVGCVLLAGLFAGAETGVYQLSRLRLRLGVEHKKFPYLVLNRSLRDSAALLISLLLGTNLAHYFATSSMTYLLLGAVETEHRAELLATLIGAPIFFIFSELIPKNLFFYRADNLMPAVSPFIYVFDKAARLCGITPFLKKLSQVHRHIGRSEAALEGTSLSTSRGYFETILMETHEEGMLSSTQTEMARRLGRISEMPVRMVMTPLAKVREVEVGSSKTDLLEICRKYAFARYPVYEGWATNVIGFINIYDCLTSEKDFTGLYDMTKPIRKIPSDTAVMDAIDIMQNEKEKMMLVTRGEQAQRPVGIVTMKDLVEELLGELAEW
jgi:CBS domain containing-hemolysin-like protein